MGADILQQLQEKEAILATAQRLARFGGWSLEMGKGVLNLSREACVILGYPEQSQAVPVGDFLECIHRGDVPQLHEEVQRAVAGLARDFSYTYRFLPAGGSGEHKWVRADAQAQVDASGAITRLVGAVIDLTDQEHARRALEISEARVHALSDTTSVWVWEQDADYRFTLVSEGASRASGLPLEARIGARRWNIPDTAPLQGTWDEHRKCCEAHKAFRNFEFRVGIGPDERVLSITGVPVYDADGQFLGYRGTGQDVTSLKQAQAQAQHSNWLLKVATRLGRVGAYSVELPGLAVTWSTDFLELKEPGPRIPLALDAAVALIHPDFQQAVKSAFRECADSGKPYDLEARAYSVTGKAGWIRVLGKPVRNGSGRITHIQGAVQDITEGKDSLDDLRRVRDALATTLESVTDAFVMLAHDGQVKYVNGAAERVLGRGRDDLLGKNVWHDFPTGVDSVFFTEIQQARALASTRRFEAYSTHIDKWLRVAVYPSSEGLAVYFRDVTEARNARQALIASEERYRLLFETSADAIVSASQDGRIRRANHAACAMFHRNLQQMLALHSFELVSPADSRLEKMVEERLGKGSSRGELTMVRADGSVFEAEVNTSVFEDSSGERFVNIVVRDATERIRLRQGLVATNDDLAERVRQRTAELEAANAELKGFARSLAHDLRQPIGTVKAFCFALNRALQEGKVEKASVFARQLPAAAQLMSDYVEGLLSLARISRSALEVEEVDLSAMATRLLDEFETQDRSRRLVRAVQSGLIADGDPTLLRLLLQNLLGNAWKFTGRTEIASISFSATTSSAGELVYCVEDNGAGFDMAKAEQLFGAFQRLHKQSEFAGTGIGLANAQKIVLRHGGRIWAQSQPGRGAAFHFTLGASQGSATRSA